MKKLIVTLVVCGMAALSQLALADTKVDYKVIACDPSDQAATTCAMAFEAISPTITAWKTPANVHIQSVVPFGDPTVRGQERLVYTFTDIGTPKNN